MKHIFICLIVSIIGLSCELYFNPKIINRVSEVIYNPFYIVYTFSMIFILISIQFMKKSKLKHKIIDALKHGIVAYMIALCAYFEILTIPFIIVYFMYWSRFLNLQPYM